MAETIVLAVGGNSLILDPKKVSVPAQYDAALVTARALQPILTSDRRLAIVHGNGPQVGFILRRAEIAKDELHPVPLDSCVADTQGALGYNIQMAVRNVLEEAEGQRDVATVVTQVLVDAQDPSFKSPSKPIGSFMDQGDAELHRDRDGWNVVEDAGRGWRRVVPSPRPQTILELEVIRRLVEAGTITIAAGGGGIPVVTEQSGKRLRGVEAVIDKDLAASLLARQLNADLFVISTAVEKVYLNFGKPDQRSLDRITVAEAKEYMAQGHFAKGSMLPKIEAMVEFVETSGHQGLITDPAHLGDALEGKTGTWIVP